MPTPRGHLREFASRHSITSYVSKFGRKIWFLLYDNLSLVATRENHRRIFALKNTSLSATKLPALATFRGFNEFICNEMWGNGHTL